MSQTKSFDFLLSALMRERTKVRVGRVRKIENRRVAITGLSDIASLGHQVEFQSELQTVSGEVVEVDHDVIHAITEEPVDWLRIDDAVMHRGVFRLYPDNSWLGRVIDSNGAPIDGKPLLQGEDGISLQNSPPLATERRSMGPPVPTGYSIFDTVLPVVRGQRVGLFSGSGVGKSSLMAAFARDFSADVVVIGLIGERGREVREFVERVLGRKGLARSVVVAATSDRSAVTRRRAAFTAITVAEYFRNQGKHVLLMMDSLTRLAEAHREIATSAGEAPAMRGHPPSMAYLMSCLSERSGPGAGAQGDITAIMTVLVSGSDMDEPVADILRGLLDGHFVLSRSIAERGRFPAIDVSKSVSRALPHVFNDTENELIEKFRSVLSLYESSEIMIRAGLHQSGGNKELDRSIDLYPKLEKFCTERNTHDISSAFESLSRLIDI